MNTKRKKILCLAAVIFGVGMIGTILADDPTPSAAPEGSRIETQLRIDVKDDVDTVHLISTNNDPDIITKTYILNHADPYEIRPYIRSLVRSERISGDATKVECIKFNDGTGALIVSAEDYKFEKKTDNSMTIDEIIKTLDMPKFSSTTGKKAFAYFPKYRDANALSNLINNVGLHVEGDDIELEGGDDRIGVDSDLNAILFYCPLYQMKNIEKMLNLYDTPIAEVKIRYAVYELDMENDDKLGVDFQAWKDGPGADVFSAAGRFSKGWSGSAVSGLPDPTGFNETKFFKFSPRWNTRYIDFLAAKGKANVVTTGEISVMNGVEGVITNTIEIPIISDGDAIPNITTADYITLENQTFVSAGTAPAAGNTDFYRISASDEKGRLVTTDDFTGTLTISRINDGNRVSYFIKAFNSGAPVSINGKMKSETKCFNFLLEQSVVRRNTNNDSETDAAGAAMPNDWVEITNWQSDKNMTIYRNVARISSAQSYGFEMRVTPSINELTASISLQITNTSLLGLSSNGTARTSTSEVNARLSVPCNGGRLVVGGVEKNSIVKSVSKLPWMGDIPGLGWLFSSESESSKKSQLVSVLDCVAVTPSQKLPQNISIEKNDISEKTLDAGKSIKPGYDQFIFDEGKKQFDPLP